MNNSTLSDSDEAAGRTVSEVVVNVASLIGFWGILITTGVMIFVIILRCSRREPVHSSAANEDAGSIHEVVIQHDGGLDRAVFSNFPIYTYAQLPSPASASSCAVCLGDYKEGQVARLLPPCGHVFHRRCIDAWLIIHSTCPICRRNPTLPLPQPAPPIANQ